MDEVAVEGQGDRLQYCNLQTDQRKGTGHTPRRTGIPERQDCSPDSLRGRPACSSYTTTRLRWRCQRTPTSCLRLVDVLPGLRLDPWRPSSFWRSCRE